MHEISFENFDLGPIDFCVVKNMVATLGYAIFVQSTSILFSTYLVGVCNQMLIVVCIQEYNKKSIIYVASVLTS